MKGYVCLFLMFAGTVVFAQSKGMGEEAAVLAVQRQWLEASQKGNGEVLRQIIDDSFVGSTQFQRAPMGDILGAAERELRVQ